MRASDGCVFCRVVRGEAPASRVAESETVLAIMDVDPVTPGHVLVMPKAHLPALGDLPDGTADEMFRVAREVAAALRRTTLDCEGVTLLHADGAASSQEVPHSHMHVIPRFPGDGLTIDARWGSRPGRAQLDAHADAIRAAWAPRLR